jgi:hypothetical protein
MRVFADFNDLKSAVGTEVREWVKAQLSPGAIDAFEGL